MKLRSLSLSAIILALASETTFAQSLPRSTAGNWIISETSSPVDYTPVVVAMARSQDNAEHSTMVLSINCRNGRTNLMITGSAISGRNDEYVISYRINRDNPVDVGAGSTPLGAGVAIQGDVVGLLQSFPDQGDISIRFAVKGGSAREATFSLGGFNSVKTKMARACNWPKPGG
jgi:hypothetical protein